MGRTIDSPEGAAAALYQDGMVFTIATWWRMGNSIGLFLLLVCGATCLCLYVRLSRETRRRQAREEQELTEQQPEQIAVVAEGVV